MHVSYGGTVDEGGKEGQWNWMQTVSCVFIQTVFVLFRKRSRDEGGGGTEGGFPQTDRGRGRER